jgi:hypothetical protein
MKILSIDVGIKNLAFCLLEVNELDTTSELITKLITKQITDNATILKWDTINLAQQCEEKKCCEIDKNILCNKPAKFTKNTKCYCLKHSKKQVFKIPSTKLKSAFINKQKINSLYQIADEYNIKYSLSCKKKDIILLINDYININCFEPVENTNASKIDLVTIGRNIQFKFDLILCDHLSSIDKVIIENQISPIANRMKTIQGMIAQYFIMKNNNIQIDFVNASNKLKIKKDIINDTNPVLTNTDTVITDTTDIKTKYSDRKKQGIEQSLEFLTHHNFKEWTIFFKTHTKKDDLADSFLQAIWYINNKLNTNNT